MNQYTKYAITALLCACVFVIPWVQAKADRYSMDELTEVQAELDRINIELKQILDDYPEMKEPQVISVCWSASQQRLVPTYQGCN